MTKRQSLGFTEGMLYGASQPATKEGFMNHLDFDKARKIIKDNKENIKEVRAGLMEDWSLTSETVFIDGKFHKDKWDCGYFASRWATPLLVITHNDGNEEEIECFKSVPQSEAKTALPDDWAEQEK